MKKSVVLLSAGLDSTVNLFLARLYSEVGLCLTFDYGQKAALREQERASQIAKSVGIPHQIVRLDWFAKFTKTALINEDASVPQGEAVAIDDMAVSGITAAAVWVPNRNGVFLSIASAFAEGMGADWVVPGFNREEAATFPDNSAEFIEASNLALKFSTDNRVEVKCFTTEMDKTQIFKRGVELGVPFEMVWPCYFSGAMPCGQCESCQRFQRAAGANNAR